MIKKVTIVLVIILVLTGVGLLLSNMGFLPGLKELTSSGTSGSSSVWDYEVIDESVALTKYRGKSSTPVIPSDIDGVPVARLSDGLFAGNTRIKEITIPDSVTSLGSGVFENCSELNLINLPSGLTAIPPKTFSGCVNLKVIQLPYGIRSIGNAAFSGCTSISYLNMPDSITSIEGDAFLNCSALSEISVSRNLNNLGSHAFKGTPWLANQKDEFVIIGNQILIKYNGIAEVVEVPLGVAQITDAFEDNIFPLEVILPASLTRIGDRAFSGCRSLETINIPDSVTRIGDSAFRACSHLNPITLPEKLTSIGASAFQSCSALERLIIPEGVRSLPSLAFANCEKLRTLQIPKSVEVITSDIISFSGVSELRVFKGSEGERFAANNGYAYSYMQQSNDSFIFQQNEDGVQVVLYTGNQYNVTIPETLEGDPVTSVSDIIFQHNYTVRSVELPRTITKISDYSFADMGELRTVTLPDTLESIGVSAFANDPMLGEMIIPESVTEIADDAFVGCPSLIIVAPEGSYAYEWAVGMGIRVRDILYVDTEDFSFVQPDGRVLISGYTGLDQNPELPRTNEYGEAVTGISAEAFRGHELRSVIIPEGYDYIGDYAFADVQGPLEITLPRSISNISDNCFENTNITIYGYNDSYAESYARNNKIKFLVIFEWEL